MSKKGNTIEFDNKKPYYMYVSQRKYEGIYEKDFFNHDILSIAWENGVYTYNFEEPSDNVFITTDYYTTVHSAKSMLALPEIPAYRLALTIIDNKVYDWGRGIVHPLCEKDKPEKVLEPGGGEEYFGHGELKFTFKEEKLHDSCLKSLLYLDRLNLIITKPDFYGLNISDKSNFDIFQELNNVLVAAIDKGRKSYKEHFEKAKKDSKWEFKEENQYYGNDGWFLESYFYFLYYLDYLNAKKIIDYVKNKVSFSDEDKKAFLNLCNSFFTGSRAEK